MLKIALVGCGRIAKRHSELLGGGRIRGACLHAVADKNLHRAKVIAEKFDVPAYKDMHEMMEAENPDVVSILTESGLHSEHVVALAPYGAHIIVEKPMALTLKDADMMIESCDRSGVKLFVVKQNRFNLPIIALREALEAGRFGKLVLGTARVRWCRPQAYYDQDAWRGTWAYDGGVLANQASHHIDLLEWMMGEVDSVFAKSTTALADIEAEDTAIVSMKFKNGALGTLEATTATRPKDLEGSLSILGENGTVEIGGFALNEIKHWNFCQSQPQDAEVFDKFVINPPDVYGFGHQSYYEHTIDCIETEKQALVDGLEGRKSLELINAMYESIQTKKEIYLGSSEKLIRLGGK